MADLRGSAAASSTTDWTITESYSGVLARVKAEPDLLKDTGLWERGAKSLQDTFGEIDAVTYYKHFAKQGSVTSEAFVTFMFLKFYSGDVCAEILKAIVKNCTDNLVQIQFVEAGFNDWEDAADATRLGLDPVLARAAIDKKFAAPAAEDTHFASLQKTAANLYLLRVMIKVLGEQAEKAMADVNVPMATMILGSVDIHN